MKKLIPILIVIVLLLSVTTPVFASYTKAHGDLGEGSVHQKFDTNPFWYDGYDPWDNPPGLLH